MYANCKIDIDKLRVLSVGVYLGDVRKNIFTPSWHLAHYLKIEDVKNIQELTEEEAKQYLQGYEIKTKKSGWVLLTYKNLPICFGKGVDGKLKNHYPKNLRNKLYIFNYYFYKNLNKFKKNTQIFLIFCKKLYVFLYYFNYFQTFPSILMPLKYMQFLPLKFVFQER